MAVQYISLIRDNYARLGYKPYRWVVNDAPPPWQPVTKPLPECRVGMVASGGIYVTGQVAFHYKDDTSFRIIPADTVPADLRVAHFGYDVTDARRDPNVVFPITALHCLAQDNVIGGLADNFFTFMGGIYSSRRVSEELAPKLTKCLLQENVDLVLLVPA